MEFGVLGPLEVRDRGNVVVVPAAKQRAVLASLLLRPGEPVPVDRLIEQLWGERPPPSARKVLQTYVCRLRRVIGEENLVTRPRCYELRVEPGRLDLEVFTRLVAEARGAEPRDAARLLSRALSLWRGPPLEDLGATPSGQAEIARLEELRLAALEARIDADLAAGRSAELIGELRTLVAAHPLREHLRAQLVLALYRSGRQAEALAVLRNARRDLVEELGIEPGSELQDLERATLRQDPALRVSAEPDNVLGPAPPPPQVGLTAGGATPFVGRRHELAVVQAMLRQPDVRMLTLTGPGGAGKTRLAVEAATRMAAAFGDDLVVVDLATTRDPRLVMAAVAEALGLRQTAPSRAAAVVAERLRQRRMLLVLDNVEQVLDAAPCFADLLAAAPAVKMLVTSRKRLAIRDEHVFAVPCLALPVAGAGLPALAGSEAVTLFVERASTARPGFALTQANAASVAELCVRLDGLPLALELAAARTPLLSPRAIVARLGRRLDLLRTGERDAPERHRTLRAAIQWSYDLLQPGVQRLFTAMGVFVGGFTIDSLQEVAGADDLDVVEAVDELVAANLLRPTDVVGDEPRFDMLETIREYAVDLLAHSDRAQDLAERHARRYLRLAERAERALRGPDQVRWLEILDAEHDNLRAALSHGSDRADPDVGLRTAAALWRFWQVRGHVHEGRLELQRLLTTTNGSAAAVAAARLSAARCAFMQGDFEALQGFLATSIPEHRRLGDDYSLGFALMILGAATGARGRHEHGAALLEEALAISRRSGDAWLWSSCQGYLGIVLSAGGDLTAGRLALEDGLREARHLRDDRCIGWMLIGLGRIAMAGGDRTQARERLVEARAVQERLGDVWGITTSLHELAALALDEGDQQAARRLLAESLPLALTVHDGPAIAAAIELTARMASMQSQLRRAARLHGCASVLAHALNDHQHDQHPLDSQLTALRDALGAEQFTECWTLGRAMTLDEAVACALDEAGDPTAGT
ncbi:BTAD domain-containing putative transcriptional regulator [Geodermatophilus sp. SYSU D00691]